MIGSLGNLVFTASANQFKTFKDINIKDSVRYGRHDTSDGKPRLEFTGENLTSISLSLFWRIEDNVNPEGEIAYLKDAMKSGEILSFLVGGQKIASGRFVVTDISSKPVRIDNMGNMLAVEYGVSLEEYILPAPSEQTAEEGSGNVDKNQEEIETVPYTDIIDMDYEINRHLV